MAKLCPVASFLYSFLWISKERRGNYLNLPSEVTVDDTHKIIYIYDAAGTKLMKRFINGNNITDRYYAGAFEYGNTKLPVLIHTDEGVVNVSGNDYEYEFFLKDHLGNTRATFTSETDSVLQTIDYYPFGLVSNMSGGSVNEYLYNGKELQDELNLEWYDYGLRFYDPQLGRWIVVDQSLEERLSLSPYNFCSNNPIIRIDSDGGLDDIVITGENNSSVTLKTDLIDVTVNASSLGIDFGGNYTLDGEDVLSAGLDIVGVLDPTGVADGLNAILQASNNQWGGAIISSIAVLPYIGDLAKVGKIGKDVKIINKAIDAAKAKNLTKAAEEGIPKSQLGPSGKPKVHTVSRPNLKEAKDAARNNPKSNTSPVKNSSEKGRKTHYHSTRYGKKLTGKDNVHYENRSSKRNPR